MSVDLGKAKKVLSNVFVESVEQMNLDELSEQVVKANKRILDLESEMQSDENLIAAKQVVKDLSAGYNNALTMEKSKIKLLIERIKELEDDSPNTDGVN